MTRRQVQKQVREQVREVSYRREGGAGRCGAGSGVASGFCSGGDGGHTCQVLALRAIVVADKNGKTSVRTTFGNLALRLEIISRRLS